MGAGCTRCCGKVQDWCRDSCGCCPCKCCKTVKVEDKAKQNIEHRTEKKDTPSGYAFIYTGVRTNDNTYTSPVLEVHTWRKSRAYTATHETSTFQRVALGGMQTERDNADHHVGPSRGAKQQSMELEEEIIVIPVESIISTKYSSEVKKGQTEHKNVRLRTPPPPVQLSCWKGAINAATKPFAVVVTTPKRNNEFEQADFDLKRKQAGTLCRLVTHLKTMVGHYPDEPTLDTIIGKNYNFDIGNRPDENISNP